MANLMKKTSFLRSGEGSISSYSWTDLAEGTGIVDFKGARASIDATPANDIYFLTEKVVPVSVGGSVIAAGTPSATEFNFDVTFNLPKVIKGKCLIAIPVYIQSTGSVTPKITLFHYDGVTETTLVSQLTLESKGGTATPQEWACIMDIPQTTFKRGETFRVCFNFDSSTSSFQNQLVHNPAGDDSTYSITGGRLSVLVPFRLDL